MSPASPVLGVPAASVLLLAAMPSRRAAIWINLAACTAIFAAALLLPWSSEAVAGLLLDRLSIYLAVLTALVGLAAGWFGIFDDAPRPRFHHALLQAVLGGLLLALLSDDPAMTWAAIAAACVCATLATARLGTAQAIQAAWRFFLIGGIGLVLALFGTLILYRAMPASAALQWSGLAQAAAQGDGAMLDLGVALLLTGYGTLAGLAPLHFWLEAMAADAPAPLASMLMGSLPLVALGVLFRLAANHAADGRASMALGLVSVLYAGWALWRCRDARRFVAAAMTGQAGIAVFAFGIGSPVARFAGLLHVAAYSLTAAALAIGVDAAGRRRGGFGFADLRGLMHTDRPVAATLAVGIVALAGLPPLGLFASLFLIETETVARAPWLALPLGAGILACGWALLARLHRLFLTARPAALSPGAGVPALLPAWLLLAAAIVLGLAMPPFVAAWLREAAR